MNILLTGGTGYIGSHTAVILCEFSHNVILYDNLSNSNLQIVKNIELITNKKINFIKGDILDTKKLTGVLNKYDVNAVIHYAGLKSVEESVKSPINYFKNNVNGTISLIEAMQVQNIKNLIFSSSATIYGEPEYLPIDESHKKNPKNPYGRSKIIIEKILSDISKFDQSWSIVSLRYFNPVGLHKSGLLCEDLSSHTKNLFPILIRVLKGLEKELLIYGNNYSTSDGTGIRDYIHIEDLVRGHLNALEFSQKNKGFFDFNLGTGKGYSVLEIVKAIEEISNTKIPYKFTKKRDGDIAQCFADVTKARKLLNWKATKQIHQMCETILKIIN